MAAPTRDRSQWLPHPPLPEFYMSKAAPEGSVKAASSHSSKSNSKVYEEENLPPPKLDTLPKEKSASKSVGPIVQQQRVSAHATGQVEAVPKNLPLLPLPPPGVTTVEASGMAYHYTHHYHHAGKHPTLNSYGYQSSKLKSPLMVAVPPPPPTYNAWAATLPLPDNQRSQFPTYHVCRICCRPRSEKYHLQNPIAIGGARPPPEICRRCRVKNVEERVVQVEKVRESSPVKIGVACLVPDDDYVTKERVRKEVVEVRADSKSRGKNAARDNDRQREITYRHGRVREAPIIPPHAQPAEVSVENLATMNLMNDRLSAKSKSEHTTTKIYVERPAEPVEPVYVPGLSTATSPMVSKVENVDRPLVSSSARDSEQNKCEILRTKITEVAVNNDTGKDSPHDYISSQGIRPGYTDSEIRKIARQEVERYRHAERLMTAHPQAYAHGRPVEDDRAVPKERRLELQADAAEPKLWEIPKVPEMEPIPSVARSVNVSSVGKTQRDPSEDSRFWYEIERFPAAKVWTGSDRAATERGRASERTFDTEIEVIVDKNIRRPELYKKTEDPRQPSEGREVIEVVRIPPPSDARSRASAKRHDFVKSARPDQQPISSRVQELKRQSDKQQRHRSANLAAASNVTVSGRSSLRTDRDYWEQSAPVVATSKASSTHQETWVQPSEHETLEMPSPRQYIRVERPQAPAQSDGTWYAERVGRVGMQQPQSERSNRRLDDDEKTVWPGEGPTRPAASERTSTARGDWDWEYTERTVQPADHPSGSKPFDERSSRWTSETERLISRSSAPAPSAQCAVVSNSQAPELKSEQQQPAQPSATPSTKELSPERGRGPYMRSSDESVHVRFASKVEFSPTPPGSDEYLPEQLPRRRDQRRQERRSGLRYQLDGLNEMESAEDLINEYETRRARSQAPTPDAQAPEFDFVYDRASAPRLRDDNSRFEIYGAASDVCEQRVPSLRGGGFKRPSNDAEEEKERRSAVSRHSNLGGRRTSPSKTETATQLSQSRPLTHALSESPSREKLRQDCSAKQGEEPSNRQHYQDGCSDYQLRGRIDTFVRDDYDNKGPYRMAERSESMNASYGSGHSGPSRRRSIFAVRERR